MAGGHDLLCSTAAVLSRRSRCVSSSFPYFFLEHDSMMIVPTPYLRYLTRDYHCYANVCCCYCCYCCYSIELLSFEYSKYPLGGQSCLAILGVYVFCQLRALVCAMYVCACVFLYNTVSKMTFAHGVHWCVSMCVCAWTQARVHLGG